MIKKTYLCRRCQHEWDIWDAVEPVPCAACGSHTTQWLPKGANISKTLRRNDRMFKQLAEDYGLTNLKDAREGEAMAPGPPQMKKAGVGYGGIPGLDVPLRTNQRGDFAASCEVITPPPNLLAMQNPLSDDGVNRATSVSHQPVMPKQSVLSRTIIEAKADSSGKELRK